MERVSCLLVTDGRLEHFQQSFKNYCLQDYPDKELVITSAGSEDYQAQLRECVTRSGRNDVIFAFARRGTKLGELRNLSIAAGSGPMVCQWDDDDIHHPSRIQAQVASLREHDASVSYIAEHFHFFVHQRELYWCNWARAPYCFGHPGTLLGYKAALPTYNNDLTAHEDLDLFRKLTVGKVPMSLVHNAPHLYTYVFHGNNTFGLKHHKSTVRCFGLEAETLRRKRTLVCSTLDDYAIWSAPIKPPIRIVDHLGCVVFEWLEPGVTVDPQGGRETATSQISRRAQYEAPAS